MDSIMKTLLYFVILIIILLIINNNQKLEFMQEKEDVYMEKIPLNMFLNMEENF